MTAATNQNLIVRRARAGDVDQVDAIHGHPWWLRDAFADPEVGPERFTVVVDGERVVSTLCLLQDTFELEGTRLVLGSPEWVGTLADYRNRGLVRAQLAEVHSWSAERRDLAQIIDGIPYFYRQFGYQYAIDQPARQLLPPRAELPDAGDWAVRAINEEDLESLAALHNTQTPAGAELWRVRSAADWRTSLRNPTAPGWRVAERSGDLGGMAMVAREPDDYGRLTVAAVTAVEPQALWAILRAIESPSGLVVTAKPAAAALLDSYTLPLPAEPGFYVRVADPQRLLEHLRPVLSGRLSASPFAAASGQLVISTYTTSILLPYEKGEVGPVTIGAGLQNPNADGAAGVSPDHLAELIFGRYGARGLDARYDDVELGATAALMETLFPQLRTDLQ